MPCPACKCMPSQDLRVGHAPCDQIKEGRHDASPCRRFGEDVDVDGVSTLHAAVCVLDMSRMHCFVAGQAVDCIKRPPSCPTAQPSRHSSTSPQEHAPPFSSLSPVQNALLRYALRPRGTFLYFCLASPRRGYRNRHRLLPWKHEQRHQLLSRRSHRHHVSRPARRGRSYPS
jgi:hypothetical protein